MILQLFGDEQELARERGRNRIGKEKQQRREFS